MTPTIYLDDPHANNWFWEYQEDKDEWWFFADDYEPVNSVKVVHDLNGSPLPVFVRGTTMPKGVREVIMRTGLALFSDAWSGWPGRSGGDSIAVDKAIVMKMVDEVLTTMKWMAERTRLNLPKPALKERTGALTW